MDWAVSTPCAWTSTGLSWRSHWVCGHSWGEFRVHPVPAGHSIRPVRGVRGGAARLCIAVAALALAVGPGPPWRLRAGRPGLPYLFACFEGGLVCWEHPPVSPETGDALFQTPERSPATTASEATGLGEVSGHCLRTCS